MRTTAANNRTTNVHMIFLLLRLFYVLAFLALLSSPVTSFQNSNRCHVTSLSSVTTTCRKKKRNTASRRSFASSRTKVFDNTSSTTVATFLSNDNNNSQKSNNNNNNNNDYNDDAFGFVFLGGFIVTRDPFFAGTFLLLSTLAAIATRNGSLPATKAVPAAVAGCTLIVALILPKEQLYELLQPFIEKTTESSLSFPVDSSWIQVGLCTVSMLYGFLLSSSDHEENQSL